MERREVRSYIARLIESHKKRVKPKGPEHMTPVQRNLYEFILFLNSLGLSYILPCDQIPSRFNFASRSALRNWSRYG
jgi:hypothetical protein